MIAGRLFSTLAHRSVAKAAEGVFMGKRLARSAGSFIQYSSAIVALVLSGLSLFNASLSNAFDGRHSRDPEVSFERLRSQLGRPVVRKVVRGKRIQVDSSAILPQVSIDKLLARSLDFNRYVQMGMPHLRESVIVERSESESMIYVWSHMVLSAMGIPMSSKHYLRVHQLPTGSEWELVPKRPNWSKEESSAMNTLDGSWYVESLGNNEAYVRYWLALEPDVSPSLVDVVVGGQLQRGVSKVIQVLAREAAL